MSYQRTSHVSFILIYMNFSCTFFCIFHFHCIVYQICVLYLTAFIRDDLLVCFLQSPSNSVSKVSWIGDLV